MTYNISMKRGFRGFVAFFLTSALILYACGEGVSGKGPERPTSTETPAAELIPTIALTVIEEMAEGEAGVDFPVEPEKISNDAELVPIEGEEFQNLRLAFEKDSVTLYGDPFGQLYKYEQGADTRFAVLAAMRVKISEQDTGEKILFGEYPGGRPGYFVQGADGAIVGTQAYRFTGIDGVEEQVWFVDENEGIVSLEPNANVKPKFGYGYDPENGEVNTFYVFDQDGVAHGVAGFARVGKVAVTPEMEKWYRAAQALREESGAPDNWRWEYTEEGELTLVGWVGEVVEGDDTEPNVKLREVRYFWNEEAGVWEERKGKDYDYAIIEGSETRVDLDGYPVSIALGQSVKRKYSDLEFNDPTVFANLMWEVEYQAWLGHKPEAEGKTLAEFKQLVKQAKAGDPAALEAITYQTWLNDMDDQAGYKPLPVTIRPLLGGGWTAEGVLQPDEIQVVVVDTEKMQNISPQATLGAGYGFSYMVDESGRIVAVYYVGGVSDYLADRPNVDEGYLANCLTQFPEIARDNKGKLKLPVGNRMTSHQKRWESILIEAMELKR